MSARRLASAAHVCTPVEHLVIIRLFRSSVGYAFVWNSPSYGYVNLTSGSLTWFSNATLNVDFWITASPANLTASQSPIAALLASSMAVLGYAPPMPWYATGFIQVRSVVPPTTDNIRYYIA